jgi:hypothetical protein
VAIAVLVLLIQRTAKIEASSSSRNKPDRED